MHIVSPTSILFVSLSLWLSPSHAQQGASRPATAPAPTTSTAPATMTAKAGDLTVKVPRDWKTVEAKGMRKAEWSLPGASPGAEASLAVFQFPQGAGSVEANLDRWKAQFEQDPPNNAEVRKSKGVVTLEVRGTYVAEKTPGSGDRFREKGYRMLASIVEAKSGPHYFKLVGPAATVERWKAAFEAMVSTTEG
jgi:hypothetical protein